MKTANQTVDYSFDELNRLKTVTDASGTTTYTYDAVGNRATQVNANGTVATYSYDPLNRLTELVHTNGSGDVIASYAYELGPNGNRLSLTEATGRVVEYSYDNLYRLLTETVTDPINGNHVSAWSYDAVGNRLQQNIDGVITTYSYNDNDHLLTETENGITTTYAYDDNGNTLTKSIDGVVDTTYGYSKDNRMLTAQTSTSNISYSYDAGGIRQSQTVDTQGAGPGVTTNYLVDPNRSYHQVLEEQDDLLIPQVLYTYGDDLISQTNAQGTHVFGYDGLGSTRILTDSSGVVQNSYGYQAFGELDYQHGTLENSYLFTGEQYDNNVGFYYLRARYYNPSIGRFQNMDTFPGMQFEPLSLHKYLYTHADPVNGIDPSGYMYTMAQVGTAAAVAGIVTAYAAYTYSKFYNAGAATWDDDDWNRPGSDGWLIIVASTLTSSQISQQVRDQINEDDSSEYEYFHGTDVTTAVFLLNKGPIFVNPLNCNWDASCGGFYLADNRGDAEHFAVFTQSGIRDGAVVKYTFSAFANQTIRGVSIFEPIPVAPRFNPMGNQLIIPPSAFGAFNSLMMSGEITPSP